ncbi:MAG: hypothetical protein PHC68_16440, partial [Syntrophorhabdaceae bacterium]|nr:hypothetical protein [Syntrophorhabdaceae bacterium]
LGAEQIDELKSKYHKGNNDVQDKKFGMPDDIQKSSRWISNVEELVEVEELEESTERRGL